MALLTLTGDYGYKDYWLRDAAGTTVNAINADMASKLGGINTGIESRLGCGRPGGELQSSAATAFHRLLGRQQRRQQQWRQHSGSRCESHPQMRRSWGSRGPDTDVGVRLGETVYRTVRQGAPAGVYT